MLLEEPDHRGAQHLVRDLNRLYRTEPALHQLDSEPRGFQWLIGDDRGNSVLAWLRRDAEGRPLLVIGNFTPVVREGYRVGVPQEGRWQEIFNSDAACYGGSNVGNGGGILAEATPAHGVQHSLQLTLPPLGVIILRPQS
ncbi:1,4-alpha-glucan branching enzyme GlgB [compost metagenome]